MLERKGKCVLTETEIQNFASSTIENLMTWHNNIEQNSLTYISYRSQHVQHKYFRLLNKDQNRPFEVSKRQTSLKFKSGSIQYHDNTEKLKKMKNEKY